ncbi:hypothetical protein DEF23_02265 [Marinitenerispora sediminis]|nr:hypothetical protein DEF23_02265 [Marinitenerispora sediminis]
MLTPAVVSRLRRSIISAMEGLADSLAMRPRKYTWSDWPARAARTLIEDLELAVRNTTDGQRRHSCVRAASHA